MELDTVVLLASGPLYPRTLEEATTNIIIHFQNGFQLSHFLVLITPIPLGTGTSDWQSLSVATACESVCHLICWEGWLCAQRWDTCSR
jgi:hypothetical protein